MKIYIPEYLREVEIIDQLYRMIEQYEIEYSGTINTLNSFDGWRDSRANDPVKKFIKLCLPEEILTPELKEEQEYEEVVNYLAKLFYSVKGTIKIFDYMARYLGLELDGDILYDSSTITINFKNLSVANEALFYNSLREFLDALICYTQLNTNISSVDLEIQNSFVSYVGAGIKSFSKIAVSPYEINYWE